MATETRNTGRAGWDDTDQRRGAVSVAGRRKSPLGWLPWAALALLALLGLLVALVLTNVTDENDEPGIELTDDETGRDDGGRTGADQDAATGGGTATTAAAAGGGAGAGQGTLRAGQASLLPVPSGGLASLTGQAVQGQGVAVESVVADEGFWVGSDPTQRVFVFLTPEARTRAGESPFQVRAGQRVNLQGSLKPVPADITPFGVDASEGADQLRQQGQYVEATSVQLS